MQSQNNTSIAKNTLLLYFRMFITMGVGLYTSRVVLNALGASDFGVYNVVGGFVSMLAYLNTVFISATQRFLSFAIGKNDDKLLSDTFSTTLLVHYCIAAIILVLAETFGLWFVNNHIVMPPERMEAANWVYQFSVFSLIFSVISIPYNSCIISHERMNIYAYTSIAEAIVKLIIAYILMIAVFDKLILYAFLLFLVSISLRLFYNIYCLRHFNECRSRPRLCKGIFKDIFSFSSWTLVGELGFSVKDQISNLVLNQFGGTLINAARGIAVQVTTAVNNFSGNFLMAVMPQITKKYAAGEEQQYCSLVYTSSKYSFFLISLIAVPIITNVTPILQIWLGNVPEFTSEMVIISLISASIYAMSRPYTMAIQATGNIKFFQIGVCVIMLLELPCSYLILKEGGAFHVALIPGVFTNIIAAFFRIILLKKQVNSSSIRYFCINIFLRSLLTIGLAYYFSFLLCSIMPDSIAWVLTKIFLSCCIVAFFVLVIGMAHNERKSMIQLVIYKVKHKSNE